MSKFRSGFEKEVSELFSGGCYECDKISYTIPEKKCKYIPDFTIKAEDGHNIYIECKGFFRDKAECDKYIYVRDSNPDIDLRFVIMSEDTLMPRSRVTTIKTWLEKNGFKVYTLEQIKDMKK